MTHQLCTLVFLLVLLSESCTVQLDENTRNRPNILLIMTDDQGWGDLGIHGNSWISTPRLDELAASSTRFTQFYVSPVCAPTRASLMNGRYSLRTGVYDTYNGGAIMAGSETTIAEYLKEAGYTTGIAGKWHLGDNYPSRPIDQGFDYSIVHNAGGMHQVGDPQSWTKGDSAYWNAWYSENGYKVQRPGYCSDVFTQSALDFVKEHSGKRPFFFYLSYNAPHTPLQVPEEYLDRYTGVHFDSIKKNMGEGKFSPLDEWEKDVTKRVYAMISNIDDNVGKLLDLLDSSEITDETVVIFMTDNGPQHRRFSGPFRGLKSTVYENGIRVPFFIRYPGKIAENHEIKDPVAHIDILPTLMDICKQSVPQNLDGVSFWPLLTDSLKVVKEIKERPLFFHWQRGFPEPYRNIAVRKGHFKLVGQTGYQAALNDLELYHLIEDPGEQNNLIRIEPAIAADLKFEFDSWYDRIMRDPGLGNSSIIIGNNAQKVTLLNRNDAKGSLGIWSQEEIYGFWDTYIEQEGNYNINIVYQRAITDPGDLILRIGTVQRTLKNPRPGGDFLFERIPLRVGRAKIDATFVERQNRNRRIMPFYLEISKAVD